MDEDELFRLTKVASWTWGRGLENQNGFTVVETIKIRLPARFDLILVYSQSKIHLFVVTTTLLPIVIKWIFKPFT